MNKGQDTQGETFSSGMKIPSWIRKGYLLLKEKKVRRVLIGIQYLIVIAIFWYMIHVGEKITFSEVNIKYASLTVVSIILLRITSIYRFSRMIRPLQVPLKEQWKEQAKAFMLGLCTPGKMGESVVVWTLGNGKEQKSLILSKFAFSKLLDGAVYIPFALLFAIVYKWYWQWVVVLLLLFMIALFLYTKVNTFLQLRNDFEKPVIYGLTFVSLALQVASFYFLLLSKEVDLSFFSTTLIWSIAAVVTLLSALPGGIGAREGSLAFLVAQFAGIKLSMAASLSLLYSFMLYGTTFLFWIISSLMLRTASARKGDELEIKSFKSETSP